MQILTGRKEILSEWIQCWCINLLHGYVTQAVPSCVEVLHPVILLHRYNNYTTKQLQLLTFKLEKMLVVQQLQLHHRTGITTN